MKIRQIIKKEKTGKANKPLVSVIMPVYNGSLFVEEAIESIFSQTYKKFELIIIDDSSQDDSLKIIEGFKKRRLSPPSKIKIIKLKNRIGAFAAANEGIKRAKGEFIAPMDSDDISCHLRLEKEVDYLLKNKDVILVGTWAKVINKEGNVVGKKVFPIDSKGIYEKFFEVHPIVHPSCMIRRDMLPDKNKLYFAKYGVNDDYYTLFTLLNYGKFANIPEYLFSYRIHFNNSSLQNLKDKFFNTVKIRFVAVKELNYKPTVIGLIKIFIQIILVSITPQFVLFTIYLFIKGIYVPSFTGFQLMLKKAAPRFAFMDMIRLWF